MPKLKEAEGGKLKPANFRHEFTHHQAAELLRCSQDVIYFTENYVKIQHPVRGSIPFRLYDYQKKLLRAYNDNLKIIAMLRRQRGKTQTAAAFLLWWAIFKFDQKILITRKDQTGATDILSRLWYSYEELPWWIKPGIEKNDITHKEFTNGRGIRALATTETTGRGMAISLLYLDEFAFVRPNIAGKFWPSIFPVISTGGKCIITSTPNTDEDIFSRIWFNAVPVTTSDKWVDAMATHEIITNQEDIVKVKTIYESEYDAIKYASRNTANLKEDEDDEDETLREFRGFYRHWRNTPDRDGQPRGDKFKRAMMKGGLKEAEWLSEFECAFVSTDSTLFSPQKLATLKYYTREPLFVDRFNVRWYEEIKPNTAYAVVMDPSEGIDLDDSCIQIWELPSCKQVAEWNRNKVDQIGQVRVLKKTLKRIKVIQDSFDEHLGRNDIYFSIERNGVGVGIYNIIEMQGLNTFEGWFIDSTEMTINKRGQGFGQPKWNRWRGLITSPARKRRYATTFKDLVERNLFIPRSKYMVRQMKTFVRSRTGGWSAKEGRKDDIVMSGILMRMLLDELRRHAPDLEDRVLLREVDHPFQEDEDNEDEHPDAMPMLPMIS